MKIKVSINRLILFLLMCTLLIPGTNWRMYYLLAVFYIFIISRKTISDISVLAVGKYKSIYIITFVGSYLIHYYSGSLLGIFSFLCIFLIPRIIVVKCTKSYDDIEWLLDITVYIFMIHAILGIYEGFTEKNIFDAFLHRQIIYGGANSYRGSLFRSHGIFSVSINNGMFMCMGWVLSLYKLVKNNRLKYLIPLLLIGIDLFLIFSRMVLIIAVFSAIMILLLLKPKKLTKYLLLGGGVLFAIWNFASDEFQVSILEFANKYFKPLLDELINFDSSQTINWGGSGERLALWGWVWEFVKGNALFGIGFESQFSHVFFANGFWKTKVSVEVQWLYILLQKGFFGLLGFVAYEWYCLRETFRAFRNDLHERPNIPIVFFIMAAGYFLNLFTCAAFEDLEFFYVLFAIVEGYTELSLGMEKDEPKEKHYQIRISPIFLNSDQKE